MSKLASNFIQRLSTLLKATANLVWRFSMLLSESTAILSDMDPLFCLAVQTIFRVDAGGYAASKNPDFECLTVASIEILRIVNFAFTSSLLI